MGAILDPFLDPFLDPQEAISALPALGLLARGGPKRGPKMTPFWTPPRGSGTPAQGVKRAISKVNSGF